MAPNTLVFTPLADPTRRAILALLREHERSATELTEPFHMTQPAISKHLKVLERAGLIARGREAQWRPCKLKADRLKDAAGWFDGYRHHWESQLDALEDYLEKKHRKKKQRT